MPTVSSAVTHAISTCYTKVRTALVVIYNSGHIADTRERLLERDELCRHQCAICGVAFIHTERCHKPYFVKACDRCFKRALG